MPKPPSAAPSVAPREEDGLALNPSEVLPGWAEPCENSEELCEEELGEPLP